MKISQALSIVAIMLSAYLSACSHQQVAKADPEESASVQSKLVAENEYKQQEQTLNTREMSRRESQRLQREQAAALKKRFFSHLREWHTADPADLLVSKQQTGAGRGRRGLYFPAGRLGGVSRIRLAPRVTWDPSLGGDRVGPGPWTPAPMQRMRRDRRRHSRPQRAPHP